MLLHNDLSVPFISRHRTDSRTIRNPTCWYVYVYSCVICETISTPSAPCHAKYPVSWRCRNWRQRYVRRAMRSADDPSTEGHTIVVRRFIVIIIGENEMNIERRPPVRTRAHSHTNTPIVAGYCNYEEEKLCEKL